MEKSSNIINLYTHVEIDLEFCKKKEDNVFIVDEKCCMQAHPYIPHEDADDIHDYDDMSLKASNIDRFWLKNSINNKNNLK